MGWLNDGLRSVVFGPYSAGDPALARLFGGGPTTSGVAISEVSALQIPAVWAAVRIISEAVASLPLILYRRTPDGGKERFASHPLYELLHDAPNDEMTSFTFRETLQAHVLLWGNAFATIERDQGGRVRWLWPVTPDRVIVDRNRRGDVIYRISNLTGTQAVLSADDVLHVPGLSFNGLYGYSVVQKARESFGLTLATEQFGSSFFGKGSTFGGILSHPGLLTPDNEKRLRDSLEKRHQGVDRAHQFVILQGGMTFQPLGIPAKDAEFLASRKFQISDVCRWFNIPPHKLRDLEHATFSNIEQEGIDFVVTTLRPWLVRWEQELKRKLIPTLERKVQFFEHLVDGLLRGDAQSRANALQIQFMNGAITIDEWRAIENRNPIAAGAGREHFVPANLVPIKKALAQEVVPTPAPTNGNGTGNGARTDPHTDYLVQRLARQEGQR